MEEAIKKILKRFVLRNTDIEYYIIHNYPTPEMNEKYYEVEIYLSLGTPMVEADGLLYRLETALKMLGFNEVYGNMFHDENKDKLLIRGTGKIKQ